MFEIINKKMSLINVNDLVFFSSYYYKLWMERLEVILLVFCLIVLVEV